MGIAGSCGGFSCGGFGTTSGVILVLFILLVIVLSAGFLI